jgi:ribose 5-phosphate isomerase B
MPQIEAQVRAIVAKILEIDVEQVQLDRHFINDLGANSLDIVELMMALEERFGVEVPDHMADEVRTVGDVVAFIRRLSGATADAPPHADPSAPAPVPAADLGSEPPSAFDALDVVAIGSDHAGFTLKEALKGALHDLGFAVRDLGPSDPAPVDYPDFAAKVARSVASGDSRWGVLVCGTGIGMAIAANKVAGVRATILHTELEARLARQHNDVNVVCFGGRVVGSEQALSALKAFAAATFDEGDDGRHARRLDQIRSLERALHG